MVNADIETMTSKERALFLNGLAMGKANRQIEVAKPYSGQLKAFRGPNAAERAFRAGAELICQIDRSARTDWLRDYCQTRGINLERTQTGTVDSLGGVTIPVEFEQSIIDLRIEYGTFRRNAEYLPMKSDTKIRNRRTGGLVAYPVAAGARGTKSTATWDAVELVARKWMVLANYEDEVTEDSIISWADQFADEAAYAFAFTEDNTGFNGDGSLSHHGIVGVIPKLTGLDGTVANVAGLVEASGNLWSEITDADIHKMIGRLPLFARRTGRVKWYCSHKFWAEVILRIAFDKGGVTYKEAAEGPVPRLYGYDVELSEALPQEQANSQVCLLFGNLSQAAMFGDRRGITVKMTDSNDTDFESDIRAIKATTRFDINVHSVGNASATANLRKPGPIVGLITQAS